MSLCFFTGHFKIVAHFGIPRKKNFS